jgi:hypothetical protein
MRVFFEKWNAGKCVYLWNQKGWRSSPKSRGVTKFPQPTLPDKKISKRYRQWPCNIFEAPQSSVKTQDRNKSWFEILQMKFTVGEVKPVNFFIFLKQFESTKCQNGRETGYFADLVRDPAICINVVFWSDIIIPISVNSLVMDRKSVLH